MLMTNHTEEPGSLTENMLDLSGNVYLTTGTLTVRVNDFKKNESSRGK